MKNEFKVKAKVTAIATVMGHKRSDDYVTTPMTHGSCQPLEVMKANALFLETTLRLNPP
jgi:hypothetical protein